MLEVWRVWKISPLFRGFRTIFYSFNWQGIHFFRKQNHVFFALSCTFQQALETWSRLMIIRLMFLRLWALTICNYAQHAIDANSKNKLALIAMRNLQCFLVAHKEAVCDYKMIFLHRIMILDIVQHNNIMTMCLLIHLQREHFHTEASFYNIFYIMRFVILMPSDLWNYICFHIVDWPTFYTFVKRSS